MAGFSTFDRVKTSNRHLAYHAVPEAYAEWCEVQTRVYAETDTNERLMSGADIEHYLNELLG